MNLLNTFVWQDLVRNRQIARWQLCDGVQWIHRPIWKESPCSPSLPNDPTNNHLHSLTTTLIQRGPTHHIICNDANHCIRATTLIDANHCIRAATLIENQAAKGMERAEKRISSHSTDHHHFTILHHHCWWSLCEANHCGGATDGANGHHCDEGATNVLSEWVVRSISWPHGKASNMTAQQSITTWSESEMCNNKQKAD